MEYEFLLIALIVVLISISLLLYAFFLLKQKKQTQEIEKLLEQRDALNEKLHNSQPHLVKEVKGSKSTLVYEQTKKIEFLESELTKHKNRLNELKVLAQNASTIEHDFLSNIQEELLFPCKTIQKTSLSLQEKIKSTTILSELDAIVKASHSLFWILSDTLDLSKIQAQRFELHPSAADIYFLISSLVEKKEKAAQEKGVALTLEVDEKFPNYLFLDAKRIQNILEHLIDNALQFTQDGFVKVNAVLESENTARNSVNISFTVEDSGSGISEETQSRLFSFFEKKEIQAESLSQSLGLGLSLDKKIARLMHGDISFKSELAKGTIFTFLLKDVEIPLWSSEDGVTVQGVDFNLLKEDAKIMLVAEHNKNYETIVDAFDSTAITLFAYSDFREAMQTLKNESVDLIFIDIDMLNNDDGAVAKVLLSTTNAAVVALVDTQISEIEFAQTALKPSGYLKKPLSKSELFKISLRLLNSL